MYALEHRRLTKQRIAEPIFVLSIAPHIAIILNNMKKTTNRRPAPITYRQKKNEKADATRRSKPKLPAKVTKIPIGTLLLNCSARTLRRRHKKSCIITVPLKSGTIAAVSGPNNAWLGLIGMRTGPSI